MRHHRAHPPISYAGLTLIASLAAGCGNPPCDETLTCDVPGDTTTVATGSGGNAATSTGSSTSAGGGAGADTTPPTIEAVTPVNSALGVSDSATIIIRFSEAMDRVATQNAFRSDTLSGLSFSWPDDQTMEVAPDNLSYALGGHDVAAQQYSYTVTSLAADLAGNTLTNSETFSFSTLRNVTDSLAGDHFTVQFDGTGGPCFAFPTYRVGKAFGGTLQECRAIMTFDTTPIPASAQIQAATLTCSYLSLVGPALTTSALNRVSFDPNDRAAGFQATPIDVYSNPFNFNQSTAIMNPASTDILPSLVAELAGSSPTTLQFQVTVGVTPQVQENFLIWRDTFSGGCRNGLSVTYLAP